MSSIVMLVAVIITVAGMNSIVYMLTTAGIVVHRHVTNHTPTTPQPITPAATYTLTAEEQKELDDYLEKQKSMDAVIQAVNESLGGISYDE